MTEARCQKCKALASVTRNGIAWNPGSYSVCVEANAFARGARLAPCKWMADAIAIAKLGARNTPAIAQPLRPRLGPRDATRR
jgi:hypothetical protein